MRCESTAPANRHQNGIRLIGEVSTVTCLRSTCILLLALTSGALAQTATSVIFGSATDASGAAIPNLAVTATPTATGVSIKVVTNESGIYVFPNLHPRTYTLPSQPPCFPTPCI